MMSSCKQTAEGMISAEKTKNKPQHVGSHLKDISKIYVTVKEKQSTYDIRASARLELFYQYAVPAIKK